MHAMRRDGQTFHLTAPAAVGLRNLPRMPAAGRPRLGTLPGFVARTGAQRARPRQIAARRPQLGAAEFSTSSAARHVRIRHNPGSVARPAFTSRIRTARAVAVSGASTSFRPRASQRSAAGPPRHHHRVRPAASGKASASPSPNGVRRAARNGNALDELVTEDPRPWRSGTHSPATSRFRTSVEHTVRYPGPVSTVLYR